MTETTILARDLADNFPETRPQWQNKTVTASAVTDIVAYTVAEAVRPLLARIAALEARPHVRYLGPWKAERSYSAGSMVSDDGSLWHAEKETQARPGSSADWILCVKKGLLT